MRYGGQAVRFEWTMHPEQNIAVQLRKLDSNTLNAAIGALALSWAKKGEGYAKRNRAWNDQTGHARDSLYGEAEGNTIYIGTVNKEYGLYLELGTRRMRAYPIIMPTIFEIAPLYYSDVTRMIQRYMGGRA